MAPTVNGDAVSLCLGVRGPLRCTPLQFSPVSLALGSDRPCPDPSEDTFVRYQDIQSRQYGNACTVKIHQGGKRIDGDGHICVTLVAETIQKYQR